MCKGFMTIQVRFMQKHRNNSNFWTQSKTSKKNNSSENEDTIMC